jgi:hypothetical protein
MSWQRWALLVDARSRCSIDRRALSQSRVRRWKTRVQDSEYAAWRLDRPLKLVAGASLQSSQTYSMAGWIGTHRCTLWLRGPRLLRRSARSVLGSEAHRNSSLARPLARRLWPRVRVRSYPVLKDWKRCRRSSHCHSSDLNPTNCQDTDGHWMARRFLSVTNQAADDCRSIRLSRQEKTRGSVSRWSRQTSPEIVVDRWFELMSSRVLAR